MEASTISNENGTADEAVISDHPCTFTTKEMNYKTVNGKEFNTQSLPVSHLEQQCNVSFSGFNKTSTTVNIDDITCELQNLDVQIPSTSGITSNAICKDLNHVKLESETGNGNRDHPQYESAASQSYRDISGVKDRPTNLPFQEVKRHKLKIYPNEISSPDSPISEYGDQLYSPETDSQDDVENSIMEILNSAEMPEKIPELSLTEELSESRRWKACTIAGEKRQIDMKVIEPYKRVLSHGGYLNTGCHNAIITFSACFLPHKSRVDYNYVMDNLFFYILYTLNQLVTDDYVLVYLHGGTAKDCIPKFSWLKRCYRMIDRKLKKNLKAVYLVHATFWIKTLVTMIKPFISSKFSRKIHFVNSLGELNDILPIEEASIPDKVQQYDRIKSSLLPGDK